MTNYSVKGSISGQVAAGETVTIAITAPDGTKVAPQSAQTLADLSYSDAFADATTIQVGTYNCAFHIDGDSGFTAADWTASFTVTPAPTTRTGTGTLTVTP
jgi:hypothetical protein